MQTYSHALVTAVLQPLLQKEADAADRAALLAGSVLPDAPLALLTVGYVLDRRYLRPHLPDKTRCSPTYNALFFHNPWWIAAHNSLHAPLPLLALALLGWTGRRRAWGRPLRRFALGCGLHTAVDIFTHAGDGPLLRFPLDWQTRYAAPISYWDPQHHGRRVRVVEHLLDLLLAVLLIWRWRRARR